MNKKSSTITRLYKLSAIFFCSLALAGVAHAAIPPGEMPVLDSPLTMPKLTAVATSRYVKPDMFAPPATRTPTPSRPRADTWTVQPDDEQAFYAGVLTGCRAAHGRNCAAMVETAKRDGWYTQFGE